MKHCVVTLVTLEGVVLPSYWLCCASVRFTHSVVSDSATPWTVARQAPLSMEFSRQEYWSGLPFPSPMNMAYGCIYLGLLLCVSIEHYNFLLKGQCTFSLIYFQIPSVFNTVMNSIFLLLKCPVIAGV